MAAPVGDSYSGKSGGVIAGGRWHIGGNRQIDIWGQSNAIGRAESADLSASPLNSDAGLMTFYAGTFDRVYIWSGSAYVKLQASNNGCSAGQFGPEFGLAVRWMRETTTGTLYINKEAFSGVSITYFDPAGANYPPMRTRRNAADAWLSGNAVAIAGRSWLWLQGETDYTQMQSWYQTRLESLTAARDSDGLQDASTKRLLMDMAVGSLNYSAAIVAAKAAVAAASPVNTFTHSMPLYMNVDNQHQNGRGQVQAAYDAFELFYNVNHIST